MRFSWSLVVGFKALEVSQVVLVEFLRFVFVNRLGRRYSCLVCLFLALPFGEVPILTQIRNQYARLSIS